jgi:phage gp45-like
MCKFLSVVVTRDGQIFHHPKEGPIDNQSHTEIIEHHKLHDSLQRVNIARVEFTLPSDPAKIGDVSEWNLILDEQREPDWWVAQKDSVQSRLKEYVDRHIYRAGYHKIQNSWAIGVGTAEIALKNSQATLRDNSHANLSQNSQATLWDNSQATLWDNSQATLWDNSQATLWQNSHATLWENSQANLRDNSQATLWGNSQATLWDNSQAALWDNSQATLWENSRATLWGNSHATLWENSQATLWQSSCATLRGNSQATLCDNSQATLRDNSQANRRSDLGSGKVVVADKAVLIDWTTRIPTITTGWQTGNEEAANG